MQYIYFGTLAATFLLSMGNRPVGAKYKYMAGKLFLAPLQLQHNAYKLIPMASHDHLLDAYNVYDGCYYILACPIVPGRTDQRSLRPAYHLDGVHLRCLHAQLAASP